MCEAYQLAADLWPDCKADARVIYIDSMCLRGLYHGPIRLLCTKGHPSISGIRYIKRLNRIYVKRKS